MAAVSARRIVGPNETGVATSRRARSSSGVKSPSGPTKMPSDGTALPATAATSFQIGGGGGWHNAPAKTRPQDFTNARASGKSTGVGGDPPPAVGLGGAFRRGEAHDAAVGDHGHDACYAEFDGLFDCPVPAASLRDAGKEDEFRARGRKRGGGAVGDEAAAVPFAAARASVSVEQLDLLARARTHHLEVPRGVVRQRDRLAGHQLLWNKQSVHGKSIP